MSEHPHLEILSTMTIPKRLGDIAAKLELFLVRGTTQDFLHFWGLISKQNKNHDANYYESLHFRVARLALRCSRLSLMEMILEDVPEDYHDHSDYKILQHFYGHFRCVETHETFFPLNVPFDRREDGPHLFACDNPAAWMAGRVDEVDDEKIYTRVRRFSQGEGVTDALFNIPFEILPKWQSDRDPTSAEAGDYFEILVPKEHDTPTIKWWGREYDGWERLPLLRIDPLRYLRYEGKIEGGQTFIEKCLRGEAEPANIDDYIEKWHKGDPWHLSGWSLADYLGMMPEEYKRWVEDPSSLVDILNERANL